MNDTALQLSVANITHYAIARSAWDYQMDSDSFYVDFYNVSGALSIEQYLCTSTVSGLNVMGTVIETENPIIRAEIQNKLLEMFVNGTHGDRMSVTIFLSELSQSALCTVHSM